MSEEEKLNKVWDAVAKSLGDDFDPEEDRTRFLNEVVENLLFDENILASTKEARKAAIGLLRYGAVNASRLKAIADTKDGFATRLSAEGVPKAICDLLFDKYVAEESKKRKGSSDDLSDNIQRKILKRSDPDGVGGFLSYLHQARFKDNVYKFAERVLDSSSALLWVRDCYPAMYDAVWKIATIKRTIFGTPDFRPVVVTGTSGIGKSFFGIYTLFRAIREKNITVVYTLYEGSNDIKRYIIAPPVATMVKFSKGDPRRLLLDLREKYPGTLGEDKLDESEEEDTWKSQSLWWGEYNQDAPGAKSFLGLLLKGESTWVFVDVQEGKITERSKRTIMFVSDNLRVYSSFVKHKDGAVLFMSVWTEQELNQARAGLNMTIEESEVKQRYSMVGGVPRSVFSNLWEQRLTEVNDAIKNLKASQLSTTLVPGSNPQVTSKLVHQVSKPPFYNTGSGKTNVTSVYASEYVRTAVYRRFLFDEQFKLKTWLEYTKGLVGGAERGPKFEWFAHVVLGKLEKDLPVKVTELPITNGKPHEKLGKTQKKVLAPFGTKKKLYRNLEDIESLEAGQYVQPLRGNEPSIDAFCLTNGLPWESSGEAPVLLLFQMTVAAKHPILGEPVKRIIKHVSKVGKVGEGVNDTFDPKEHDIYLVFVFEDLLPKAEAYISTEKTKITQNLGHLKKIKQVCLQLE